MKTTRALMPRARRDELVVEELDDETLVYDLERHKARCLNHTAALVWRCWGSDLRHRSMKRSCGWRWTA
jgi:hypothetical protein